jgi:hypothetical protein
MGVGNKTCQWRAPTATRTRKHALAHFPHTHARAHTYYMRASERTRTLPNLMVVITFGDQSK